MMGGDEGECCVRVDYILCAREISCIQVAFGPGEMTPTLGSVEWSHYKD